MVLVDAAKRHGEVGTPRLVAAPGRRLVTGGLAGPFPVPVQPTEVELDEARRRVVGVPEIPGDGGLASAPDSPVDATTVPHRRVASPPVTEGEVVDGPPQTRLARQGARRRDVVGVPDRARRVAALLGAGLLARLETPRHPTVAAPLRSQGVLHKGELPRGDGTVAAGQLVTVPAPSGPIKVVRGLRRRVDVPSSVLDGVARASPGAPPRPAGRGVAVPRAAPRLQGGVAPHDVPRPDLLSHCIARPHALWPGKKRRAF